MHDLTDWVVDQFNEYKDEIKRLNKVIAIQKDFINRLIEKQKLAQKELDMIIFDMDTIDGEPATQEELCEIFNILNNDEE
jgi:chromosomal replication initiation ATPase DnaA